MKLPSLFTTLVLGTASAAGVGAWASGIATNQNKDNVSSETKEKETDEVKSEGKNLGDSVKNVEVSPKEEDEDKSWLEPGEEDGSDKCEFIGTGQEDEKEIPDICKSNIYKK